jgi:hypothetical protein
MMRAADLPPPGAALSRRIEAVAAQYLVDRYSGPGNPMQTQILRQGSAIATKVPFVPQHALMNAVHGLENAADLPAVLAFYAQTKQPCWVEVAPHVDPAVSKALADHGFKPAAKKAVLYGPASARAARDAAVEVEPIGKGDGELALFLDTINAGFDVPANMLAGMRRNQAFWCDVEHWRLYLAKVDGEPAGAAVLAITDGLGYLAAGSTLPAYRRRGVHAALVARRLADAALAGCEFATGQAELASGSHRNQERAGLALAHVRQDWTNAA